MLLPLFEYLSEFFGPFRVVEFLSTRAILATLTSLIFSLILGPRFINKMKDIQVGQVIREEGPETHLSKQGTPRKLMDVSKMKAVGWEYETALQEGIEKTYQWFLEHVDDFKKLKM